MGTVPEHDASLVGPVPKKGLNMIEELKTKLHKIKGKLEHLRGYL